MSKDVRNISTKALSIPGVGVVEPGATVKVPDDFRNPNFEDAKAAPKKEDTASEAPAAPAPRTTKK